MGEIERLLPIMLETAKLLRDKNPQLQFVLPLASTVQYQDLAQYGKDLASLKVSLIENSLSQFFQSSQIF